MSTSWINIEIFIVPLLSRYIPPAPTNASVLVRPQKTHTASLIGDRNDRFWLICALTLRSAFPCNPDPTRHAPNLMLPFECGSRQANKNPVIERWGPVLAKCTRTMKTGLLRLLNRVRPRTCVAFDEQTCCPRSLFAVVCVISRFLQIPRSARNPPCVLVPSLALFG